MSQRILVVADLDAAITLEQTGNDLVQASDVER
jgi:hypothetical protein